MKAPRDLGSDRPLLDKLGVKPGLRVSLLGVGEDWFRELLAERTDDVHDVPAEGSDLVFLMAEAPADLDRLRALRRVIKEDGAVWVLRRKGAGRALNEVDVIDAARAAGLVDNKIASFSDELGAMRLVVRIVDRTRP
ncbi:MAG TPA: DUF3052 family protein [Candidatus Dormibacteraeota bacterium]